MVRGRDVYGGTYSNENDYFTALIYYMNLRLLHMEELLVMQSYFFISFGFLKKENSLLRSPSCAFTCPPGIRVSSGSGCSSHSNFERVYLSDVKFSVEIMQFKVTPASYFSVTCNKNMADAKEF
jgi:hypothetical protein